MAKKVRIKKARNKAYWYADKIGEVYEVAQSPEFCEKYEVIEGWRKPCKLLDKDDVSTIREIDGVLYEEVERMAGVGEFVINPDDGIPTKVTAVSDNSVDVEGYLTVDEDEIGVDSVVGILHGYYRVLEPIDVTPTDELLEIIANLTRRVHELERDNTNIKRDLGWYEFGPGRIANLRNGLSDIRHTVGQLEDEVAEIKAESEDWAGHVDDEQKKLRDDVTETLGTITDLLRKRDRRIDDVEGRLTEVTEGLLFLDDKRDWLSYRVNNIKKKVDEINDKAEMLIDDVVLLDERTEGLR
ncbi:hypothetical protein J26TS2_00580 [Shouchella clausii]|nr:hypothetical protein J26TS2_00580 [Shouchella clausii]